MTRGWCAHATARVKLRAQLWSRISSSTLTRLPEFKCKRLRLVQQAPLPTEPSSQLSGLFSLHNLAGIPESCRWFLCFLAINVLSQLLQPLSLSQKWLLFQLLTLQVPISKVSLQRTLLTTLSKASFSLPYITVFPNVKLLLPRLTAY